MRSTGREQSAKRRHIPTLLHHIETVKTPDVEGRIERPLDTDQVGHVPHSKFRWMPIVCNAILRFGDRHRRKVDANHVVTKARQVPRETPYARAQLEHTLATRPRHELDNLRRYAHITPKGKRRAVRTIKVGTGRGNGISGAGFSSSQIHIAYYIASYSFVNPGED